MRRLLAERMSAEWPRPLTFWTGFIAAATAVRPM
jgi:hypothetical protein